MGTSDPLKPIIFFDGVCNLCNGAVQFIIKRDPTAIFQFAPLQSESAIRLIDITNKPLPDSIILWSDNKLYFKSSAALEIARHLPYPWRLLVAFRFLPVWFRDPVYDLIARNRYRWFGKRDSCMIPTPDLLSRFLR